MLVIRNEQLTVFEEAAVKEFESRTTEYIELNFPKHYEIQGVETIRTVIHEGVQKAWEYGFILEKHLTEYICLMFTLGSAFDRDIQFPWATAILEDDSIPNAASRMDGLLDMCNDYLDAVAGADNIFLDDAIRKVENESLPDATMLLSGGFQPDMFVRLKRIWPEKCACLGATTIGDMIQYGFEAGQDFGLFTEKGMIVYVGLMFMLGSDFATDPQFPWSREVLTDASLPSPDKDERLHEEAMRYLNKWK
jgi:hypothetical protein